MGRKSSGLLDLTLIQFNPLLLKAIVLVLYALLFKIGTVNMTHASDPNRLDRLEALAETTLLAIRELSNRQDNLQQQQDNLQRQQDNFQRQQEAAEARMERLDRRFEDIARQQALNAEQISANTAGLIELRNLFADFLRTQQR